MLLSSASSIITSRGLADIIEVQDQVDLQCQTEDGFKMVVPKGTTVGEADECGEGECQKEGTLTLELAPCPQGLTSTSQWVEVTCKDCPSQSSLVHGLIAFPDKTLQTFPTTVSGSYYTLNELGFLGPVQGLICELKHDSAASKMSMVNPPVPSVAKVAPISAASDPVPAVIHEDPVNLLAPNCAETIIVNAAKKTVANLFKNRSLSGGRCALGVRESLQKSQVGDIEGSLGNAADYLETLKKHGFVDSGLRDPNIAPAGAVIIFEGPKSQAYFKNGKFGHPAGSWLGHVTIKGGDGFYYTDGRTKEPAIGWSHGKNVEHIRNVAGIYVPNAALISEYKSKCK